MSDHASNSSPTEFAGAVGTASFGQANDLPMNMYVEEAVSADEKSSLNCFALCVRNFSVIIAAILISLPKFL